MKSSLVAELNYDRRLGVEHEASIALVGTGGSREVHETLANVLTANGLRTKARGYSHAQVPQGYDLAVEHDASVRGDPRRKIRRRCRGICSKTCVPESVIHSLGVTIAPDRGAVGLERIDA